MSKKGLKFFCFLGIILKRPKNDPREGPRQKYGSDGSGFSWKNESRASESRF